MILGVGLDVVDLAAFSGQLGQPGTSFATAFTARERREAGSRARSRDSRLVEDNLAEHLAARWAAKEAFVKAWSAALRGSEPPLSRVSWHEIEVVSDAWHRPALVLHGEVSAAFTASLEDPSVKLHVSMSHDGPVAQAIVILEKL